MVKKTIHPKQGKVCIIYKVGGKVLDKITTFSCMNPSDEVKEIVIEDHYSNHVAYQQVKQVTQRSKTEKAIKKFEDKFAIDTDFNI
ncbi:MAG: hypothetical protein AAFO15_02430 [Pseudomonadota bacterium]